jgi:ketosteroid isomerase-like protein
MHRLLRPSAASVLLFLAAGAALAGPAGDSAQAHFRAVAGGQVENLLSHYADDATLEWVGGPLDGRYAGKIALGEAWNKFARAQGELTFKVSNVQESANPKGATVTANVVFGGKSDIKIRYVLTYRDGKIVNEVWQIDPNLAG